MKTNGTKLPRPLSVYPPIEDWVGRGNTHWLVCLNESQSGVGNTLGEAYADLWAAYPKEAWDQPERPTHEPTDHMEQAWAHERAAANIRFGNSPETEELHRALNLHLRAAAAHRVAAISGQMGLDCAADDTDRAWDASAKVPE